MDKLKRLAILEAKKNDILYLLNRHAQNKETIWENDDKGYEDYVNAALDEINEINEEIKEIFDDEF